MARDMRESGVELSAEFAAGARAAGATRRRPRARLDRHDVLRRRAARRPGRDVHRLAQPRRLQRDQDLPRRGQARRPGHGSGRRSATAPQEAIRTRTPTAGRRSAATSAATCSTSTPSTSAPSSTPSPLRPLKVVADTANGMGGLVVPRVFDGLPSTSRSSSASSTARSPTTPPTPSRTRTSGT